VEQPVQGEGTGGDGKKSIELFAETENFRALCLFVVTSFAVPLGGLALAFRHL
jgi:hypothetical protein